MNPLELLKALEAVRDEAAELCCWVSTHTTPSDLEYSRQRGNWPPHTAPFAIHAKAHAACEAAYADMEAEARASEGVPV